MRNFFPIIFIIISIAIFVMVVNPIYGDAKKLRNDVSTYSTALTNATNLQRVRDNLIKNYQTVTDNDKIKLDHFLPNTVDNIQLILQIQSIATSHNMVLKNIHFDSQANTQTNNPGSSLKENSNSYGVFELSFSTDAKYEDFILFLKDIESNIRLINVKGVSFNVPTSSAAKNTGNTDSQIDPNVYTYSLQIETYWLK